VIDVENLLISIEAVDPNLKKKSLRSGDDEEEEEDKDQERPRRGIRISSKFSSQDELDL
jgi:hypothetical protein